MLKSDNYCQIKNLSLTNFVNFRELHHTLSYYIICFYVFDLYFSKFKLCAMDIFVLCTSLL